MHLSRKQLAIVALVVILAVTNIALAVLYMTKSVDLSGGVSVVGEIEVYDEDGTTPLTSYDFPLFTGGSQHSWEKKLIIKNTGNQPVYVYWNISSSSIVWEPYLNEKYNHYEGTDLKYWFLTYIGWTEFENWTPNDCITPEALYVGVGAQQECRFTLHYSGNPATAETFTMTVSFYAQDA